MKTDSINEISRSISAWAARCVSCTNVDCRPKQKWSIETIGKLPFGFKNCWQNPVFSVCNDCCCPVFYLLYLSCVRWLEQFSLYWKWKLLRAQELKGVTLKKTMKNIFPRALKMVPILLIPWPTNPCLWSRPSLSTWRLQAVWTILTQKSKL